MVCGLQRVSILLLSFFSTYLFKCSWILFVWTTFCVLELRSKLSLEPQPGNVSYTSLMTAFIIRTCLKCSCNCLSRNCSILDIILTFTYSRTASYFLVGNKVYICVYKFKYTYAHRKTNSWGHFNNGLWFHCLHLRSQEKLLNLLIDIFFHG